MILAADWFTHELVIVAAPEDESLVRRLRKLKEFLDRTPHVSLGAVAYTCARRFRAAYACPAKDAPPPPVPGSVAAFVVSSSDELRLRLATVADRIAAGSERIRDRSGSYWFRRAAGEPPPKMAYVLPGALSFYPDMMRDLSLLYPVCRSSFDLLEQAMEGESRFTPSSFIFPPAPCYRRDAAVFAAGGYAEAMISVMTASGAMLRLLSAAGLQPDAAVGMSGGDLMALAQFGAFRMEDRSRRIEFLRASYRLAARVVRGMPALSGIETVLPTEWSERFKSDFRSFAKQWMKSLPKIPVYTFASASPMPDSFRAAREAAAETWYAENHTRRTAQRMYDDGIRIFVEVGPRSLMATAFHEALRNRADADFVVTNRAHRSGLVQLQHALALLAAHGRVFDPTAFFGDRREREINFDEPLALEVRATAQRVLRRDMPRLTFPPETAEAVRATLVPTGAAAPGSRARARAAAQAEKARRQRKFDFGAAQPLVSDAEITVRDGGTSVTLAKTFTTEDAPLFASAAIAGSQLSYSDRRLRGFTPLPFFTACEIMAELAARLVPGKQLVAALNLRTPRALAFVQNRLALVGRAERIVSDRPDELCVSVTLDEASVAESGSAGGYAVTFVYADRAPARQAFLAEPLRRPRSIHWTSQDIYPARVFSGETVRGIRTADLWSDEGLDYEVVVPAPGSAVGHTRFPIWEANPQLLAAVADGFALWRSHVRFSGSFSMAFRLQRLDLVQPNLAAGTPLRGYLRLRDATERTQIADVDVTDGNGNLVLSLHGYEELTERVPAEYPALIHAPAGAFLTHALDVRETGADGRRVETAWLDDIPYSVLTRNDGLWLSTVSRLVLSRAERKAFASMQSTTAGRRTEWLFGRIAAKEAVRRYLLNRHQARWGGADVEIVADEMGKPRPVGAWSDYLSEHIDVAISHTADFVYAAAGANVRIGVDVERCDRDLTEDFVKAAFSAEESELAATCGLDAASLRFWCAKEAVSKALGTGLRYSPRELTVSSADAETGCLSVALNGLWLDAFRIFRGRPVPVKTTTVRGHIVASCFIDEALLSG